MMQKQHLTYWLVFLLGIGLGAALSAGFADATCPAERKAGGFSISVAGTAPASVHPMSAPARVEPLTADLQTSWTASGAAAAPLRYDHELLLFVPEQ
ncbi:MAG: hypothetical protein D6818_10835 [Bacteroidetes bacterium]|nr:MAG: hypothetical protein D6818_10835 [Bacteroidota bacterium]